MKRLKINSLNLFYLLYFTGATTAVTIYLIHVLKTTSNTETLEHSANVANYAFSFSTVSQASYNENTDTSDIDAIISSNKIVIPSKESMLELKDDYKEISSRFSEIETLKGDISVLYENVLDAPVCSIANRNFNLLLETYNTYKQKISEIQKYISLYEEKYQDYLDRILEIPKFLSIYQEKYDEFNKLFLADFETVSSKKISYNEDEEMLYNFYIDSKRISDELFEEYYDLMCHIVFAESGNCSEMEQCFVANVIENRIKHPNFPNTLYDVLHSPGQYEPVMTGTIHKTPSDETRQIVENYLRGNVETGMPDNVLYQSLSPNHGSGVWNSDLKTKNIFCYY